ncbi:uncharacterized protein ALTATR162_LOCUS3659 [Alternaria atra]|uniref:Uncharacterized protein n=1 Tax=Alternaria atra TaxID=119953 RepID=A0A8J2N0A8_9PLEO|nr:uncharacterized protein ALTATR162_LOCUS3659 [Alternaria atra]CAG5155431.1 unnamed protein product [Alternaria atra]
MGGHAFKGLYCPRISPAVYNKVKAQTTAALQTIFAQVVVPTEMPCKDDYGDVDFLVCGPLHSRGSTTLDDFPWQSTICLIKDVLDTTHGRQGYLTQDCMYFAIDAPHGEENYFIQIDVKVCFRPELFHWCHFELNYASNSKMIGSMIKPLGLTIDSEGIHIRVEEIEETNFPGSMVWISKDPKDALRILGLDRRILNAGFKIRDEIYEYIASSWLFHPGHFAARLAEEKYNERLEDRAPYWTHFIKEWVPKHYIGYCPIHHTTETEQHDGKTNVYTDEDLQAWYRRTRATVRDKVFTMLPHIATEYYNKRAAWAKEREEQRLRDVIANAIPSAHPSPLRQSHRSSLSPLFSQPPNPPLYIDALPRVPPVPFAPQPPPPNMSPTAKLLCLFRWTLFDPETGTPLLATMPREKDFQMQWMDVQYAGATDDELIQWAREAWWYIWMRQAAVNYVGL